MYVDLEELMVGRGRSRKNYVGRVDKRLSDQSRRRRDWDGPREPRGKWQHDKFNQYDGRRRDGGRAGGRARRSFDFDYTDYRAGGMRLVPVSAFNNGGMVQLPLAKTARRRPQEMSLKLVLVDRRDTGKGAGGGEGRRRRSSKGRGDERVEWAGKRARRSGEQRRRSGGRRERRVNRPGSGFKKMTANEMDMELDAYMQPSHHPRIL